ncbi:hypothetical protein IT570_10780 [Candidatus Sumerlaeota bacterium]|nr:hypothetical protein [Candidatus Sumerlaeota bacterium]
MNKAARIIIAAALCTAIIVWCRARLHHQRSLDRWNAIKAEGAAAALSSQEMPELQRAYRDRALIRLNRTFPPDRPGIRADMQQAIVRSPLSSELWFSYAQNELFAGDVAHGRSALQRSDELDPFFPGQLLRSIQLWNLLGEQDRAIAIARNVASLGYQYRVKSADELSQMGIAPREIFNMVSTSDLTPQQTGEVLNAIRTNNREQLSQIFATIPNSAFDDPQFRQSALQRASDPLMLDVVERIWRAESPDVKWLEGCLVDNTDLRKPPFASDFPLGWQPIPSRGAGGGAWAAPDFSNEQTASIRIEFPRVDWGSKGPVSINYPFYRLPWDGRRGTTISVAIQAIGEGTISAWLSTTTRGRRIQSKPKQVSETTERVEIYVPKSFDAEILTIAVNARAVGETPGNQSSLLISNFTLEADGPKE